MAVKRIIREWRLSDTDAASYDDVRRTVASEKPQILLRMRTHQRIRQLLLLLLLLRDARRQAGLSLADMRDRTGIDWAALSKLEGGIRDNPTLLRYAAAVGKPFTLDDESK